MNKNNRNNLYLRSPDILVMKYIYNNKYNIIFLGLICILNIDFKLFQLLLRVQ